MTEMKKLETDLLDAAKKGDVKTITACVKAGANVSVRDPNGATPLLLACASGNYYAVKELIEAGADVKAKQFDGSRPLDVALIFNFPDIVRLLIAAGCAVYRNNRNLHLSVLTAVQGQCFDSIREIVKHGYDLNVHTDGYSPIYSALLEGDIDMVKELFSMGARLTSRSFYDKKLAAQLRVEVAGALRKRLQKRSEN